MYTHSLGTRTFAWQGRRPGLLPPRATTTFHRYCTITGVPTHRLHANDATTTITTTTTTTTNTNSTVPLLPLYIYHLLFNTSFVITACPFVSVTVTVVEFFSIFLYRPQLSLFGNHRIFSCTNRLHRLLIKTLETYTK